MFRIKHAALMVVMVSSLLVGCANTGEMNLGQYKSIKSSCESMGLEPQAVLAYKSSEQRMITKSVTCIDPETGAAFDLTRQ